MANTATKHLARITSTDHPTWPIFYVTCSCGYYYETCRKDSAISAKELHTR